MPIGSVINPLIRSANALPALRYDKRGDFVRPCLAWSSYFGALFGVIVSRCGGRHLPYRACLPLRCLFCVRTPWYSAFSVAPPPHLIISSPFLSSCLLATLINLGAHLDGLARRLIVPIGSVACPCSRLVFLIRPASSTRGAGRTAGRMLARRCG